MYTTICTKCKQTMGVATISKTDRDNNPDKKFTVTCPSCATNYEITSSGIKEIKKEG